MQSSTWYCTTCGAANDSLKTQCFACGQAHVEDAPETPGAVMLQGRYRLLSQVGVGGFGVVYKALDTQGSDRTVAIKQINLRGLTPQKMIEATDAFNREVQHLTPLQHRNLPRVYDHFTDPDHWYLVMEFIEGETLEHYLETPRFPHAYTGNRTLLPLEEIFPLAFQLCDVLSYLHTCHPPIIFRDIKPANIMRTAKGHLYLIDFGIARHFKPGQARDTTPLGSPGYAAPEQYGKAQSTPRTDLYSLGALLHHLLTGDDPAETLFQFAPLPQVAGAEMQIQQLDALIRRMAALDSEQRPDSAGAVKEELQGIARLARDAAPRIWYPPQGQTPPSSMTDPAFTLPSARQQLQAQRQKSRGTSRRKFITRSLAGGAVTIIGITVAGSLLASLSSFGWHREVVIDAALPAKGQPTSDSSIPVQQATPYPAQSQQTGSSAIAWSPDGKQVAFVSPDGSFAEVYAVAFNGRLAYLNTLQDKHFPAPIRALAWSPDGTRIATGKADGGVDIWFITGTPGPVNSFPLYYPDHSGAIDILAWSPDSKLLAISSQQNPLSIRVAQTGKIIYQQRTPVNRTRLFSWSRNSNRIVIENDLPDHPGLQVRDVTSGKQLFTFGFASGLRMVKAAWSPDVNTIATLGENGNVFLWNADNGSYIKALVSPAGKIVDLLWSPDSQKIALETEYGSVQVWHVQNYHLQFYPVHSGLVRAMIWLLDGRIALIDENRDLQYLNVDLR